MANCPANGDVLVVGTDNVWRTDNFFSAISSPGWASNSPEIGQGITALAFAPSSATCETYAYGLGSGGLFVTTNADESWSNLDPSGQVPGRQITGLDFHPTDGNTLYVTLSGFDGGSPSTTGHLFKTTNALAGSPTWSNISPPVNIPHNAVRIDRGAPNTVYVATDIGVWRTTDGGTAWTHMGPEVGMPNVAVYDIRVSDGSGRLVAFTHGRGAFTLGSVTPTTPKPPRRLPPRARPPSR
jgi:photosystem II stability/assembly factor-like uncharacterized protein